MRISDWSSDVCSSDLAVPRPSKHHAPRNEGWKETTMVGSLWALAVAGLVLLLSHFGVSSTSLRDRIVAAIGVGPYLGLYLLVSLAVTFCLVMANPAPVSPWELLPVPVRSPAAHFASSASPNIPPLPPHFQNYPP